MRGALPAMLALLLLGGCASMLLGNARPCPAAADGIIAALECQAGRGDKPAQLALAKRLEDEDPARAATLYRAAASFTSGTIAVYVPGANGAAGTVMQVRSGPDRPGLAEAKYRLGLLYLAGRGVPRDVAEGQEWIRKAIEAGFRPPSDRKRDA
jgi:hypothetical protein